MKPAPRPVRPPGVLLSVTAGIVVVSGIGLIGAPRGGTNDTGLTPRTIARHLADVAPKNARDVRISGIYGSGHRGTWQFGGFVTWHDPSGAIRGGGTELPQHGGQPAINLGFSPQKLATEYRIGWTEEQVAAATSHIDVSDAALALVVLEITAEQGPSLVACSAPSTKVTAECAEYDVNGDVARRFDDKLLDVAGLDAASVQRASDPLTQAP